MAPPGWSWMGLSREGSGPAGTAVERLVIPGFCFRRTLLLIGLIGCSGMGV
jgi:hypothetical protein